MGGLVYLTSCFLANKALGRRDFRVFNLSPLVDAALWFFFFLFESEDSLSSNSHSFNFDESNQKVSFFLY